VRTQIPEAYTLEVHLVVDLLRDERQGLHFGLVFLAHQAEFDEELRFRVFPQDFVLQFLDDRVEALMVMHCFRLELDRFQVFLLLV